MCSYEQFGNTTTSSLLNSSKIFEIGRRLKEVRDNPKTYGFEGYRDWERWCSEKCGFSRRYANQFIKVYDEFGEDVLPRKGLQAMYEIATMPEEAREIPHIIPSTGETKTVDEMTVRELREVKKALKEAEQSALQAETARRQAEIDPIKKARIAQFLKEYWGVKQGKKGQNVPIKKVCA